MAYVEGPLREPAWNRDEKLFRSLDATIERKLAFDAINRAEPFDDDLIEYADYPDGKPAFLRQLLQTPRYRFPIRAERKDAGSIDRRKSMSSGPFYTNSSAPWLGENGQTAEPLVQLDLRWAGEIGEVELGDGLLQVWADGSDAITRVIRDLSQEPEPLPDWAGNLSQSEADECFSVDTRESGVAAWTRVGHEITGVEPKRLDLHQAITRVLENEIIDRSDEYPRALVDDADDILKMIRRLGSPRISQTSVDASTFGNYHPWNWDAGLEKVLLNLESDDVLCFKGEGQATCFYDSDAGTFEFRWGL